MRSVNTMLAWGHARVIENLMGQKHRMNPPPVRAISDQFASNKETVAKALMSLGRGIELVQKHRAEEDLAVAAASILARHEFVTRLASWRSNSGWNLPKGASAAVDAAAKEFIAKYGAENLPKVAQNALSHRVAGPRPARTAQRMAARHGAPVNSPFTARLMAGFDLFLTPPTPEDSRKKV